MVTTAPAQHVSQQARSTETSRRLLVAAEALLAEKSFEAMGVAELAMRAGLTTGAFYARFRDKEAVLQVLEGQFHAALERVADAQAMPADPDRTVEEILRQHHTSLVRTYREHRGAARALLMRANQDEALRGRIEALNRRNLSIIARSIAKQGRIRDASGRKAIQFALLAVRSVCREVILLNQSWPGAEPPSDKVLVAELTRMVMGYLAPLMG